MYEFPLIMWDYEYPYLFIITIAVSFPTVYGIARGPPCVVMPIVTFGKPAERDCVSFSDAGFLEKSLPQGGGRLKGQIKSAAAL